MVINTLYLCSAFNPSKVHTHSSEHTPGAVRSHFAVAPGEQLGVRCLAQLFQLKRLTSDMVSKVEESAGYSPPSPGLENKKMKSNKQ